MPKAEPARWAGMIAVVSAMTACGGLVPERPDVPPTVATTPDVVLPEDVPNGIICSEDSDCAPFAGCCFDFECVSGLCEPRLVDACCSELGPCATTGAFEVGHCEATCVAQGCRATLGLPTAECGTPTWDARFDAASLAGWSFEDTADDRVAWHASTRQTFEGGATLRAGDILCANYHGGPETLGCVPTQAEGGPIHLVAHGPPMRLPEDRPSVVLVWLWLDVGAPPSEAVDGLEIEIADLASGMSIGWTSRGSQLGEVPERAWTPVALDVSGLAGRDVRVTFTFDAPDGRGHDHEGAYIGAARVWTPCALERLCPNAGSDACAVGRMVPIGGVDDAICAVTTPDPGLACTTCASAASCSAGSCEAAICEAGRCGVTTEPVAVCCDPSARWPGNDGSFEALEAALAAAVPGAVDGWLVEGAGWSASRLRARSGAGALHFGLADGSAIAAPGEVADGTVWTPTIVVPSIAPRWWFWVWLETEWDAAPSSENPAGLDRMEALVRVDATPGPTGARAPVWASEALGGTTNGGWAVVSVDLTPWAGLPVRLGWRFTTGDGENNAFAGAFVDDAVVLRSCPGCAPERRDGTACDPTLEPLGPR